MKDEELNISLKYYEKSNLVFSNIHNKYGVAATLNNIGKVYNELDDFQKALEYFDKSLKIKEEVQDNKGVSITNSNIGGIYLKQNKRTAAFIYCC